MDVKQRAAKAIEALCFAVKDANIWCSLNTGEQWLYQWIPLTVSKLAAPSQLANAIRDRIKDWREIGIDERQLGRVPVPNRDRRKLVAIGAISAVEAILVEAFLFAESLEFLANDLSAAFDSMTPDERKYWLTVDPAIAFGGDEAGLLVRDKFEACAVGRIVAHSAVGAVVPSDHYAWAIDEIFGAELGPSVAEHGEGGDIGDPESEQITATVTAKSEKKPKLYQACLGHPTNITFQKAAACLNTYITAHPNGRKKREYLQKCSENWSRKLTESEAETLIKAMADYERRHRK